MKTDPTLTPDLELMPRADLPVIWDEFRAKAEQLRETANTLVVSSVEEKDKMELARTTRLTLKQIRVAVEKKRIELGQGHLAEIQKINGAANKLKELIEPLETRLLHEEQFADRVEADRVLELSKRRNDEVRAVWPGCPGDFGKMSNTEYDALLARLRAEVAEIAEAKRRQSEVEAQAAREREAAEASRRQMQAQLDAQQAETQRQARAAAAETEIRLAAERAKEAAARAEVEARFAAERQEAEEKFRREQAEKDRLRDEELKSVEAKRLELEVQLANERAAKLAEERRLHALAVAPDKEQLQAFHHALYQIPQPDLKTDEGRAILNRAQSKLGEAFLIIDVFCAE